MPQDRLEEILQDLCGEIYQGTVASKLFGADKLIAQAKLVIKEYVENNFGIKDDKCYYCGEMTNSFAGNPGKWPVVLSHSDEPGKPKCHHEECVILRLDHAKEYYLGLLPKEKEQKILTSSGYVDSDLSIGYNTAIREIKERIR